MKIRNGFVSNSSSSSFLIYGVCLDEDEICKKLHITDKMREEDDFDLYEIIEEKLADEDMEVHCPDGYDGFYIGRSFVTIRDNETGAEFKKSVKEKLQSIFGSKIKCDVYEEAYYS